MSNLEGIKVETGVEKIPATNGRSICDMDASDFITTGLKVGAFAGIAYLATQAIVGTANGIGKAVGAGCSAAANAAKKAAADKGGEQ